MDKKEKRLNLILLVISCGGMLIGIGLLIAAKLLSKFGTDSTVKLTFAASIAEIILFAAMAVWSIRKLIKNRKQHQNKE